MHKLKQFGLNLLIEHVTIREILMKNLMIGTLNF